MSRLPAETWPADRKQPDLPKWLFSCMRSDVLPQITECGEVLAAAFRFTVKRFPCVKPLMCFQPARHPEKFPSSQCPPKPPLGQPWVLHDRAHKTPAPLSPKEKFNSTQHSGMDTTRETVWDWHPGPHPLEGGPKPGRATLGFGTQSYTTHDE